MSKTDNYENEKLKIEKSKLNLEEEKLARSRWWHEDSLVHNRLTWLLQSQIILFAAYGWFARVARPTPKLSALLDLLPILGISVCIVIVVSVNAAWKAQKVLSQEYAGKEFNLNVSDYTSRRGRVAGHGLPSIFLLGWAYMLYKTFCL
ncbi:MAG: hypothetical protein MRK01_03455 [Candidatus Scalindua sp.]|nr:hypothetical protein [Candidatus Scalindua sp.]